VIDRLRTWLLGAPKNPLDPRIHRHLALIAFFAWVGLGSDGLSSSCYGPEEIFRQLASHRHLALYLVAAVVGTVFLISASYAQIIEHFPSGGGGYLVATKLLGPGPGVVSGSALVVDYVLTVAISVAAGCDGHLLVPARRRSGMEARSGVWRCGLVDPAQPARREGVGLRTDAIFLVFIVSHTGLILFGVLRHGPDLPQLFGATIQDTRHAASDLGLLGLGLILLRAFSLGGGTYTGNRGGEQRRRHPSRATC
jgi:amino acid transporter